MFSGILVISLIWLYLVNIFFRIWTKIGNIETVAFALNLNCMKSDSIWSFSRPYSVQTQKSTDQKATVLFCSAIVLLYFAQCENPF